MKHSRREPALRAARPARTADHSGHRITRRAAGKLFERGDMDYPDYQRVLDLIDAGHEPAGRP